MKMEVKLYKTIKIKIKWKILEMKQCSKDLDKIIDLFLKYLKINTNYQNELFEPLVISITCIN